ncbi:MAG: acireductone synthase [Methylovulum sp.]|nr:acireductone synthase [Methylovulum sp.]
MIKAIVTDIEGTTSSLSFVKDVLFPYAYAQLPEFVRQHQHTAPVAELLHAVALEAKLPFAVDSLIKQLLTWSEEDQKVTALKALQGLIWEIGYQRGDFTGHIYQDAAEQLRAWHAQGLKLYVYSSGSVHAQKLLFAHTSYGDLTPLFTDYFDTQIGPKQAPESYQKITDSIGIPAEHCMFLSDIKEELDAAKQIGFNTICLCRDQLSNTLTNHQRAKNFAECQLTF